MEVSVVIPCHGGADDTVACLQSLRAQDSSNLFDRLQLVVVDNASPDDTVARATALDGVEVLAQPSNLGFAGGVNAGLRAARGAIVVVLNNDTLAAPNLIHRLIEPLLGDVRIGITAPVSNRVKGFARIDVGELGVDAADRREIETMLGEHHRGRLQDVDSLSGLCLAMRQETAQRIGPFDERFGRGNYEDDDFSLRARLLGCRLAIVRDAFVHHHGSRTFQALGMDYGDTLAEKRQLFLARWRHDSVGRVALAHSEGDYDRAAEGAAEAMRRHARWPDGDLILGRHHHRRGRPRPAIVHLSRFLGRCPQHTDAWIMLAIETMKVDGQAAGEACIARALATCYFSEQATLDLLQLFGAWLLTEGRPETAAEKFAAALQIDPGSGHFHNLLGKAQLDAGQVDGAERSFAAAYAGGEPRGILGQGVCQWQAGHWREALVTLSRAARELPGDAEAQANLETVLQSLEQQGVDATSLRQHVAAAGTDVSLQ